MNDWADRSADALTGRWRPIPLGVMAPALAVVAALVCGGLALTASLPFGWGPTGVLGLGLLAGWWYDVQLKRTMLSFVPFAIAFPLLLLWATLVSGRSSAPVGFLLAGVAVLAVGLHLADALPDIDGDRDAQAGTLAVVLGSGWTTRAIMATMLAGALIAAGTLAWRPILYWPAAVVAAGAAIMAGWLATRRPRFVRWMVGALLTFVAVYVIEAGLHA